MLSDASDGTTTRRHLVSPRLGGARGGALPLHETTQVQIREVAHDPRAAPFRHPLIATTHRRSLTVDEVKVRPRALRLRAKPQLHRRSEKSAPCPKLHYRSETSLAKRTDVSEVSCDA